MLTNDLSMDLQVIAETWLDTFARATLSGDVLATVQTFLPDGYLRDQLVLTWDLRSLEGHDKIKEYLVPRLTAAHLSHFRPDTRAGYCAERSTKGGVGAAFTFETPHCYGRGYVRLLQDTSSGQWKALSVFLGVADIKGYEELGREPGHYGGHTLSWTDIFAERRRQIERDPYVIVIGAGHNGLNTAARLKHWNIPTLVIEKNDKVGDQWRERYPTLSLHSIRHFSHFSYQQYPDTWPEFAPRDKMADWQEQYVKTQDLVVWTRSTILPGAHYDTIRKRWTLVVDHAGTRVELHPAHVVSAVGSMGPPRMPHVPERACFDGVVIHSGAYPGGAPYVGKHVVVVGACQSAADICQDLAFRGAASVTMVQRSSTCVVDISTGAGGEHVLFPDDVPIDVCDLKFQSLPINLNRRLTLEEADLEWEREKELHAKLRRGGLKLNMGKDGSGHVFLIYERLGGWDFGLADYIASGRVKVKQGVEVKQFTADGVMFNDSSSLPADVVIFATGWLGNRESLKEIFGTEIVDSTGVPWGLDDEGEISNTYRPTGHPGLWYAVGDFGTARFLSKLLALQIKATQIGILRTAERTL
ncbi:hypothetical protein POSPLADRAFT_1153512 [Postia placenta MAD-698-R-SB12]|uniref:FAD/NAD(P)-binding domain-containing protein n=1 Tax=Postia placenta MAD-698-R-SB12 TaxID=670580 RepID=A0A1X6MQJ5_9APHY|nr:hypothetical protein POSPLADRAFT_1153512 [Postia placenta MAD-698-R-SB12]OSX58694.1 hypothetical protein POSPLADRAFT_1153512 [Postia placenta MAD-698-R-SB12]